jgi:hypothetical protein
MAWGGSLDKNGSDNIRKMREADKVIEFLEHIKPNLEDNQIKIIEMTIEIIVDYFNKKFKV